ncbi:MAG: glycoside hydrolase family 57, partial [Clostridia bacterium]|nr:glycoside hydrolase family 57 [Clostridia bacterium]
MKNGIIFMPHGNLQYSQLPIEKRAWVSQVSYDKIFDLPEKLGIKIAFEASGETLEIVAKETPEVMAKLIKGIKEGRIEPVASPQTHIMLGNIDAEIGYRSLVEGLNTWERLTGVRPTTGWNPECSWNSYIVDIYKRAGFKTLIADADSYFLSTVEGVREKTGLKFDVRGHSNKNELFKLEDIVAGSDDLLKKFT